MLSRPLTNEVFEREHIHGDVFIDFAGYAFRELGERRDFDKPGLATGKHVLFVNTHFIKDVFAHLTKIRATGPFLLITHNSDHNVTRESFASKPDSVKRWYAQNVVHKDDNLIPIPIGIERSHVGSCGDIRCLMNARPQPIHPMKLAYMNFSTGTNRAERQPAFDALRNVGWVTNDMGVRRISFAEHCERACSHRFIVSPPGNGLDCHRTWEALYMGVIPIVKRSAAMDFFASTLPMLVTDDYTKLTNETLLDFLENKQQRFVSYLKRSYWKARILNDFAAL